MRSVVGASAALFVPTAGEVPTGVEPVVVSGAGISDEVITALDERIVGWLAGVGVEQVAPETIVVSGVAGHGRGSSHQGPRSTSEWRLLVSALRAASGEVIGAVAVARPGAGPEKETGRARSGRRWSGDDLAAVQHFAGLCAAVLSVRRGPRHEVSQRRLDGLVTRIAVELMPVSAASLLTSLRSILQLISEFFEVDTSFLRHNDVERDMSVLVAEWPRRENVSDPDPLGEVPFGVDPVFDATRELKEPFVLRPTPSTDAYQERVQQGAGVPQVSMAMVPMIRGSATIGVLGFVKFGDRSWDTSETNALQAVASLIVQLEARIDAEDRLAHNANHDDLTGLPNRRALLAELDRRLGPEAEKPTALLFLDLDRFKVMNDSLGHSAGDRLLLTIAGRLSQAMGPGDFVARLAGDEFVFLVEVPDGPLEVIAVAERLLGLVAKPSEIGGHHITRTASLGIAIGQPGALTPDDLLAQADAALHSAKARGGDHVVVFDKAMRIAAAERSETELLLREAIDRGDLLLHYQPEINLRTGELLAVEALVRWVHPRRGLLAAGSFIEVAEHSGLIVDLGRWVMGEACRQMATWRAQYPQLRFKMRVNMSPAQLASQNIVRLVSSCLADNRLPGRLLCLEITEHAVMQDVKQALQSLHELRSLGVTLAIDDFGTGFSSMAQLKTLPVDTLKVDQRFVFGLGTDGGDRAIVDATVRLARSFGLDVVAEGVETNEMVRQLLSLGCYRAQGFLLSRPKSAAELEPILQYGGINLSTFSINQIPEIPVPVEQAPSAV
jgi:diguanylate cyclase (GGDEF)-like protein